MYYDKLSKFDLKGAFEELEHIHKSNYIINKSFENYAWYIFFMYSIDNYLDSFLFQFLIEKWEEKNNEKFYGNFFYILEQQNCKYYYAEDLYYEIFKLRKFFLIPFFKIDINQRLIEDRVEEAFFETPEDIMYLDHLGFCFQDKNLLNRYDNIKILETLLSFFLDPDDGNALYFAVKRSKYEKIKILLEFGASINYSLHPKPILSVALSKENNTDILKLLLESGADKKSVFHIPSEYKELIEQDYGESSPYK